MKKAISAIVCLLVAVSVHAGIMDKWADGALEVRQIPGSEQALKDYFAGDSGVILQSCIRQPIAPDARQ